jgi:hypothetical protein
LFKTDREFPKWSRGADADGAGCWKLEAGRRGWQRAEENIADVELIICCLRSEEDIWSDANVTSAGRDTARQSDVLSPSMRLL